MRDEAKERKPHDYRGYDLIPGIGSATFLIRTMYADIRRYADIKNGREISGLKEDFNSTFNLVTLGTYQTVSNELLLKLLTGKSFIENIFNSM